MDIARKFGISLGLLGAAAASYGSGFGLYQPSATSHAMGGALVGKAMDASANFNNPATLTDLTNLQFTVGFVSEHPRGRVDVSRFGGPTTRCTMDPSVFWLPHFQLAVPLPADFSFGFGMEPDYGLGTEFDDRWPLNFTCTETKIQSMVLTPNIAYKITDDWSVAVGLRFVYFDFEQYSYPQVSQNGVELGRFGNRLRGDNGMKDFGWQIGTKYDVTDTFSVGLVYKSWIDVSVDGKTCNSVAHWNDDGVYGMAKQAAYQGVYDQLKRMNVPESMIPGMIASMPKSQMEQYVSKADATIRDTVRRTASRRTGSASAEITLPQSVAAGCNWDVLPTWHLGSVLSWTQWTEFDTLHFDLQGGNKDTKLDWRDTWRWSVGSCWDFAEDWKWMVSYTYDMDCTSWTQQSAMLPPADRHILATGLAWKCWGGLELALSYACIFMDGGDMTVVDAVGDRWQLETCWGFCHAAGFSVTYRF